MKVWITGARGFIGQHLSRYIQQLSHDVAGIGHGHWPESERRYAGVNQWLNGDISQQNLDVLLQQHGIPDAIFHLAGGSSVGPSLALPLEDMHRSVSSIGDLLEWVRLRSPKTTIVMASSAAVYGAGHTSAIHEDAISTPYSPYGFHKRMAELLMESYSRSFGLKVAVVRLFSVYGPGLRKQLLWDACSRLSNNVDAIQFGGSGNELRDWIHVEDAAALLWKAMEHATSPCAIFNGGSGIATSVHDITKILCDEWSKGAITPSFSGKSRVGDPASLVADTSRLQRIGFKAAHEWSKGIVEYVEWFKGAQV